MADFITQFSANEVVSRENFNNRITQANTAMTNIKSNIDNHKADNNNPHKTTLLQVGGSNENLLISSNFRKPINQRGLTSYAPNYSYTIDMWSGYQCTVTVGDGYIDITGTGAEAKFFTRLEDTDAYYGQHTLSFNVGGTIYSASGVDYIYKEFNDFELTLGLNVNLPVAQISGFNGKTLRLYAAKLEVGDASTLANDPPPNPQQELAKCQRYYRRYGPGLNGFIISTNTIQIFLPFQLPMRISPALNLLTSEPMFHAPGININGSNIIVSAQIVNSKGIIAIELSGFAISSALVGYPVRYNAIADLLELSAEL